MSWESKGTDPSNNTKYKLCKIVGVCYSLMGVIWASLPLSIKIQSSHKFFFHNTEHWLIINGTFFHTFKDFFFPSVFKYQKAHFSYQIKELHLISWVLEVFKVVVNIKMSQQKLELGFQLLGFSAVAGQTESSVLVARFCNSHNQLENVNISSNTTESSTISASLYPHNDVISVFLSRSRNKQKERE